MWWANPHGRLLLLVGWCPGVLAGDGGHAIGLSASGWLVCAKRGHRHVGVDPDLAATALLQWLPDIWEIWYFTLPPLAVARVPPLVTRPSSAERYWHPAVARECLYRVTITVIEDWYAR